MKYRSDLLRTGHEMAAANFAIGAISEAEMREFDEMCLIPEDKPALEVNKRAEPSFQKIEHITA